MTPELDVPEEAEEFRAYPKSVQPGIPTLGEVPAGWQQMPMGDLLTVVQRPAVMVDDQSYELVTARRNRGGIVSRGRLTGKQIATKTQFWVKSGDFVMSRRQIAHGACGVLPKSLDGALVSNEYAALLPTAKLDRGYLRHLPHSIYFQQTCFHSSIGVHVEKLVFNLDHWLTWPFLVPPPPEQRRIAAVLDAWDAAIAVAARLLEARQNLHTKLMRDLYATCVEPTGVRPGWTKRTIADLAEVVGGGTPSTGTSSYWGGKILWCTPTDLTALSNRWISATERTITETGLAASAAAILPVRSVILCSRASVGECAINLVPMATNQGFQNLVPHDDRDAEFLLYLIKAIKKRLIRIAAGSTFLEFGRSEIRKLAIQAPDPSERRRIGGVMSLVEDGIDQERGRLVALRHQKSGLMQQLLTGKLRTTDGIDALFPSATDLDAAA